MERKLYLEIRGIPGSGKSRLAKIIINHLKAEHHEYHIVDHFPLDKEEFLHISVDDLNEGESNAKNQNQ